MRRRSAQAAAIAAVLLVLAAGLCLFDGDGDDHDGSLRPDLCTGMMAMAPGTILVIGPPVTGSLVVWLAPLAVSRPLHVLDPPPKFTSRS
jgi:hypothetical protein